MNTLELFENFRNQQRLSREIDALQFEIDVLDLSINDLKAMGDFDLDCCEQVMKAKWRKIAGSDYGDSSPSNMLPAADGFFYVCCSMSHFEPIVKLGETCSQSRIQDFNSCHASLWSGVFFPVNDRKQWEATAKRIFSEYLIDRAYGKSEVFIQHPFWKVRDFIEMWMHDEDALAFCYHVLRAHSVLTGSPKYHESFAHLLDCRGLLGRRQIARILELYQRQVLRAPSNAPDRLINSFPSCRRSVYKAV